MTTNKQSNASFWRGFMTIFRFLIRLTFVIVLAIGLGAGIYYGAAFALPALQHRYIQPVEDNTSRLDQLEAQQEQKDQLLETLQARLNDLETQNDSYKATISMLEEQETSKGSVLVTQSAALATLQPLPETALTLDATIADMQAEIEDIAAEVQTNAQKLDTLSMEDKERSELGDQIQQDLQILQTMEFLTRARLYLSQGNFEQAKANIEASLSPLSELAAAESRYEQTIALLEEALEALPDNPVSATDRVDGAWQLLVQESEPTTAASPTLTPTPQASATPTHTPSE